jgi:hypothetical protein
MVNVDDDTRDMLRALAYASGDSMSGAAAECLRTIIPVMAPVVDILRQARTAPAEALQRMTAHAEAVAEMAREVVAEARRTPPSSNTGG